MRRFWLMSVLMIVALAGCKLFGGGAEDAAEAQLGATQPAPGATTQGLSEGEGAGAYEVRIPGAGEGRGGPEGTGLLARRTLYFDFDSAQVRSQDIPVVQAHAQYLLSHPQSVVTLEGHTDERGSREYNIALGEARAKSVARLLEVNGVGHARLRVISYGEEKPVALGHDESAWQKNRRVEIVYGGR